MLKKIFYLLGIPLFLIFIFLGFFLHQKDQKGEESKVSLLFKFAVVGDSHNENERLGTALSQAKIKGAEFIIHVGDLTNTGTLKELQATKNVLESYNLKYFVIPGNHDVWENQGPKNFDQVFGTPYQAFEWSKKKVRFILVDNSDEKNGLGEKQREWLERLIRSPSQSLTFVFAHEPLFAAASQHIMGQYSPQVASEAAELTSGFTQARVVEVFSGHLHYFYRYLDPASGLKTTIVGAAAFERNPQTPRFALVTVFEDLRYNVEEVEIK